VIATHTHILATAAFKEAQWLAQEAVRRYGERMEHIGARFAIALDAPNADKPALLAQAALRLGYERELCEKSVMSAKTFMRREERAEGHKAMLKLLRHPRRVSELQLRRLKELAGCDPAAAAPALPNVAGLAEFAEQRPFRLFAGAPSLDAFSVGQRNAAGLAPLDGPLPGLSRPGALHSALYWSAGKYTFAEILRRVSFEYTPLCRAEQAYLPDAELATLLKYFKFMGANGLLQWLAPGAAVPKAVKPEMSASTSGATVAVDEAVDAETASEAAPAGEETQEEATTEA
jgi:hypothetical protein